MSVVSISNWRVARGDWSQRDLASLYRTHDFLNRQGIGVGLENGLTDLGEPWCVFYDTNSEEVVAHFARNEGRYLIACGLLKEVAWGATLDEAIDRFYVAMDLYLEQSRAHESARDNKKVVMHPATRLVFGLSALFFLLQFDQRSAQAAETDASASTRDKAHDGWIARASKYVDAGSFSDAGSHHFMMAAAIGLFFASKSSLISVADGSDFSGAGIDITAVSSSGQHEFDGGAASPLVMSDAASFLVGSQESAGSDTIAAAPDHIMITTNATGHDIAVLIGHEVDIDLPPEELSSPQTVKQEMHFVPSFEGLSSPVIEELVPRSEASLGSDAKQFVVDYLGDLVIKSLPDDSPVMRVADVFKEAESDVTGIDSDAGGITRMTVDSNDIDAHSFLVKFIHDNFEGLKSIYEASNQDLYLVDSHIEILDGNKSDDYYILSVVFDDNTVVNVIGLSADVPDLSAYGLAA